MDHILQCHEENGGYKKHILEMFQRHPIQSNPSFENMSYSNSTLCCLLLAIILVAAPHTAEGQREITFTTNINTYASELNAFRQAVRTTNKRFDYFLLPLRTAVSGTNRYREINLRNSYGVAVKLAIDIVNVYVLAYHTSNPSCRGSYFFNDADARAAMSFVFRNSGEQRVLPFDGSYGDLAANGGSRRNTILGLSQLSDLLP
ncbi:putative ribosome-inactivating protein, partial [Momordica charantia]|uniref:rRNA N-glycosylase n=1 Tax=Momordica charantia TaxID=3673 RepID=A0A6J1E098_MOMCH